MRTESIVPLDNIRIGLHHQNLKNHTDSDLFYAHPHHLISSIQPSPGDSSSPHYGQEIESLPHTINENSTVILGL